MKESGQRRVKSHDPFKMWGAWLGAAIALVPWAWLWANLGTRGIPHLAWLTAAVMGCGPVAVVGFLFGWGLHSLARYFAK